MSRKSRIFNGIFYYNLNDASENTIKNYLKRDNLRNSNNEVINDYTVDCISFGENKFYKFWKEEITTYERNYLYNIDGLSFSFFISNLISYLHPISVANNNFLWFPVDKSFEERIAWKF